MAAVVDRTEDPGHGRKRGGNAKIELSGSPIQHRIPQPSVCDGGGYAFEQVDTGGIDGDLKRIGKTAAGGAQTNVLTCRVGEAGIKDHNVSGYLAVCEVDMGPGTAREIPAAVAEIADVGRDCYVRRRQSDKAVAVVIDDSRQER